MPTLTSYPMVYALMSSLRAHILAHTGDNTPTALLDVMTYTNVTTGESELLAPGLVVLGYAAQDMTNLLNDATKPSWGIEIHGNTPYADQMAPQNEHEIAASTKSQDHNLGLEIIPRELDGTTTWWRKLFIHWSLYMTSSNEPRNQAVLMAMRTSSLMELLCSERTDANPYGWNLGTLIDPFGEVAHAPFVGRVFLKEAGGPPHDFIWYGALWVQVLTTRP
jgi:hypothetical protein